MTAAQTGTSLLIGMAATVALAGLLRSKQRLHRDGFRESWNGFLQRWIMGTAYALMPSRIADVPFLLWHSACELVRGGTRVPDPGRTYDRPDTFGGLCRDVSPETILAAARLGFFPWCHFGPLKWWTRKEHTVLFFADHHVPKRLRREMRKTTHYVTFDKAFKDVIKACAGRRSYNRHSLTWITPQIMRLYTALHEMGHAHSFEVWSEDGRLVGGGYGLAVGRAFYTESQFSLEANTSKMGFASLNHHLAKWGFVLNDGKDYTPTIDAMGFRAIPRTKFEAILRAHAHAESRRGPWHVEDDLAAIAG